MIGKLEISPSVFCLYSMLTSKAESWAKVNCEKNKSSFFNRNLYELAFCMRIKDFHMQILQQICCVDQQKNGLCVSSYIATQWTVDYF